MEEIWKDIPNYEGLYQASNLGRIKSIKRVGTETIILKQQYFKTGYCKTALSKNHKQTTFSTHRIIAKTFIPNPNNLPQINHKDGNKHNNCADNLEWVTRSENIRHAIKNKLITFDSISKGVIQYKNGVEIARYKSIQEAKKITGCKTTNISRVCKGIYKHTKGYGWKYIN